MFLNPGEGGRGGGVLQFCNWHLVRFSPSVVDPYALNLDPDSEFWSYCIWIRILGYVTVPILNEKFKIIFEKNSFLTTGYHKIMVPDVPKNFFVSC